MATIKTNAKQVAAAFRKDAEATVRVMDQVLERGAITIARTARSNAPKARTTLTNSIAHARLAVGRFEVVAQARYAAHVEDGAGPGGWVPKASLQDWMKVHGVTPRDPSMSFDSLTKLLQRSIHAKGTPAQPFFQPAIDAEIPGIEERMATRLQAVIDRPGASA